MGQEEEQGITTVWKVEKEEGQGVVAGWDGIRSRASWQGGMG